MDNLLNVAYSYTKDILITSRFFFLIFLAFIENTVIIFSSKNILLLYIIDKMT